MKRYYLGSGLPTGAYRIKDTTKATQAWHNTPVDFSKE
jgi:hypothetical protein